MAGTLICLLAVAVFPTQISLVLFRGDDVAPTSKDRELVRKVTDSELSEIQRKETNYLFLRASESLVVVSPKSASPWAELAKREAIASGFPAGGPHPASKLSPEAIKALEGAFASQVPRLRLQGDSAVGISFLSSFQFEIDGKSFEVDHDFADRGMMQKLQKAPALTNRGPSESLEPGMIVGNSMRQMTIRFPAPSLSMTPHLDSSALVLDTVRKAIQERVKALNTLMDEKIRAALKAAGVDPEWLANGGQFDELPAGIQNSMKSSFISSWKNNGFASEQDALAAWDRRENMKGRIDQMAWISVIHQGKPVGVGVGTGVRNPG